MNVERDSHDDSKSSRFTREEAQRRLDEVRRRYGIHLADPQVRPIVDSSSTRPKESAKQQPRPTVSVPKTPLVTIDRMRSDPALKRGPIRPASGFPSDNQSFHYLIRIAECASILHCEVKADNSAASRERVERIPNLMEWREISLEELAKILKDDERY